jgi:hypothetical protein
MSYWLERAMGHLAAPASGSEGSLFHGPYGVKDDVGPESVAPASPGAAASTSCRGIDARFGYEKAALDDTGEIVGLNKASLYYYNKSKEDI